MNWTNWWHGAISATITFSLVIITSFITDTSAMIILLCCLPGPMGFFFREQAQREMELKSTYRVNGLDIPLIISFDACKFWQWTKDSQLDFYVPAIISFLIGSISIL